MKRKIVVLLVLVVAILAMSVNSFAALKTYFRYAEEKNIIVHNPINKVRIQRRYM